MITNTSICVGHRTSPENSAMLEVLQYLVISHRRFGNDVGYDVSHFVVSCVAVDDWGHENDPFKQEMIARYWTWWMGNRLSSTPMVTQIRETYHGWVQERCNSCALAMELHLSCINPLIYAPRQHRVNPLTYIVAILGHKYNVLCQSCHLIPTVILPVHSKSMNTRMNQLGMCLIIDMSV